MCVCVYVLFFFKRWVIHHRNDIGEKEKLCCRGKDKEPKTLRLEEQKWWKDWSLAGAGMSGNAGSVRLEAHRWADLAVGG